MKNFYSYCASLLLISGLALGLSPTPAQAGHGWFLVYFNSEDCADCKLWEEEGGKTFLQSVEGKNMHVIKVGKGELGDGFRCEDFADNNYCFVLQRRAIRFAPSWVFGGEGVVLFKASGKENFSAFKDHIEQVTP